MEINDIVISLSDLEDIAETLILESESAKEYIVSIIKGNYTDLTCDVLYDELYFIFDEDFLITDNIIENLKNNNKVNYFDLITKEISFNKDEYSSYMAKKDFENLNCEDITMLLGEYGIKNFILNFYGTEELKTILEIDYGYSF